MQHESVENKNWLFFSLRSGSPSLCKIAFFQKKHMNWNCFKKLFCKLYKFVLNCFGQFQLKMYHLGYKITMTRLKGMQCNKIPVGGVDQICDILISFFVFFILNLGVNYILQVPFNTCLNPTFCVTRVLFIQIIYFWCYARLYKL